MTQILIKILVSLGVIVAITAIAKKLNRGGVDNIQYSSLILSHRSKFEAEYTEPGKNIDTPVGG
jgi:hypothetical protein